MKTNHLLSLSLIAAILGFTSGCLPDPGLAKRRTTVTTASAIQNAKITTNTQGCGQMPLIISLTNTTINGQCATSNTCPTGTHSASNGETSYYKSVASSAQMIQIAGSLSLCVDDTPPPARPTNAIDIVPTFCSCINGVSDIINDCNAFCSAKTKNSTPTLYLDTLMGPEIASNTKLGNLYNWCNVQLDTDVTSPQCMLSATDGVNTFKINVSIQPSSNSLTADLTNLNLDKTYLMTITEIKSGSVSKTFQLRRKTQPLTSSVSGVTGDMIGAIKVATVSQYSCLNYGGYVDTNANFFRTNFVKNFYYFTDQYPAPIDPAPPGTISSVVCYDEQNPLYNAPDKSIYPRLELKPVFAVWNTFDPHFVMSANVSKPYLNTIIEQRLVRDFHDSPTTIDIFQKFSFPNRPNTQVSTTATNTSVLGFIMLPFIDANGFGSCPTQSDFTGNNHIYNILGDYIGDTEGLYIAEADPFFLQNGASSGIIYTTIFATEQMLIDYGYYYINPTDPSSMKVKVANATDLNSHDIKFNWPNSLSTTPPYGPLRSPTLLGTDQQVYSVRYFNELKGNSPTITSTSRPPDRRIGCIPKL